MKPGAYKCLREYRVYTCVYAEPWGDHLRLTLKYDEYPYGDSAMDKLFGRSQTIELPKSMYKFRNGGFVVYAWKDGLRYPYFFEPNNAKGGEPHAYP